MKNVMKRSYKVAVITVFAMAVKKGVEDKEVEKK